MRLPAVPEPALQFASAETAIGVDPVGTVDMVLRVVAAFERWNVSSLLEEDRAPRSGVVAAR